MGAGRMMEMAFAIKGALDSSFVQSTGRASDSLNKMRENARKMKEEMKGVSAQQKLLEQNFKAGKMAGDAYGKSADNLKQKMDGLKKGMQDAKEQQQKLSQAMKDKKLADSGMSDQLGALKGMALRLAPLAFGLQQAASKAMKFESAMADVRKVVDFDTPKQFKEMGEDILALTRTLPMTAEDLAKIVAAGGQSGIAREDLLAFAESAAKMGTAFDITADQAGDMMAKWRTAFHMNQQDVVTLADKINYLGNTTAASAPLISDVVTRIGPLGEIGGVASGEIAAMGASMVGTGVQSEIAATGIKNLILGMTAGEGATKSQAAAFAMLGMDAGEMAKRMQVDSKGAILDVMEALKGLDKDKQAFVLSDLFGKESIGAITPLLSNLDNLKENFNRVADSSQYAGSMEKEFQARCQTTENSLQLSKNALVEVGITLGSVFLPYLKDGLEVLAKFVQNTLAWAKANPETLQTILQVAGGLAALTLAFKLGVFMSATYDRTMKALRLAQATYGSATKIAAAGQWALNIAMNANPVGLVVAGIVLLIGILYLLYTHFDQVKQFCARIWESPAAAVLAFVAGPIGLLIYAVSGIIANWDTVKAWFILLWNEPGVAIEQFVTGLKNKLGEGIEWAREKWETLKETLSHPIDAVVNFMSKGKPAGNSGNPDISSNAAGGIYGKGSFLTTFAEKTPEAAIPLDGGSPRAISLWQQAGAMLFGNSGSGRSGGTSATTPQPGTVTIQQVFYGNADPQQVRQAANEGAQEGQKTFAKKAQEYAWERERVSFA